ncbi:MAG: NAD(+) synthase [Erysipelotrichaceae bacterium]|nr:NAD(+) synthase [Erysipelotrichaceae bacterium]
MFDAVKEKDRIVEFIRNYYETNHLKGAVLGVSGGKDSAVVAALMCAAIGPENVVGLTLPCHSKPIDAAGARLVADRFGFELLNIDLTDTYDTFKKQIDLLGEYDEEAVKNSDINIKPRMRMMSVYYMAALLSAVKGGTYIVPGTSNACELYVGYFTKGGDSVYDIAPIYSLTVEEVIKVGEVLGVPEKVLYRTPDDGLSGMSDEEKLGVSYNAIARVMNGLPVSEEEEKIINRLHRGSRHKFNIPVYKKED